MLGRTKLAQQFSGEARAKARRHCQGKPVEGSIQFHGRHDATTVSPFVSSESRTGLSLSGWAFLVRYKRRQTTLHYIQGKKSVLLGLRRFARPLQNVGVNEAHLG